MPSWKPPGGAGPVALVARLVSPGWVTSVKVSVTGAPPPPSRGCALTPVPVPVLTTLLVVDSTVPAPSSLITATELVTVEPERGWSVGSPGKVTAAISWRFVHPSWSESAPSRAAKAASMLRPWRTCLR